MITRIVESEEGNLNINSLFAGFISGLFCTLVLFAMKKIRQKDKMLRFERIRDLSYYGRKSADRKS